MSSYLEFKEMPSSSGKTKVVHIFSRMDGSYLGEIRWFGKWRQYAFFPGSGTVWNPECLLSVNSKIQDLVLQRRNS